MSRTRSKKKKKKKKTLQEKVCKVGLEFAVCDSKWRVSRVRVSVRDWVRQTLTLTLNLALATLLTRNKSNPKLQANFTHFAR